jgi:demethylmenaquinone methyltransferase / 2-methoxy-6-polyprenyl-1,4-benzoquinol methylase
VIGAQSSAREVRAMFTRIAGRYDLMNSVMTAGRHHAWRRVAARAAVTTPPGPILDLATGTADLALAISALDPARRIVGADFSEAMLVRAARKLAARGEERRIPLVAADALRLPFPDRTFASVTSAFLLRNLEDLRAGLSEMRRVTMPGGSVVTLDIVQPATPVWSTVFNAYFTRLVPVVGALLARDRAAYTYLPQSVARFVTPDELTRLMEAAGLRAVKRRRLGLGTIAVHVARA